MKEEETEIEEGAGDRLLIDQKAFLHQMPSARADHQDGVVVVELVVLAFFIGELDSSVDGVSEIDLAVDVVGPGGRVGVFKVGHEDVGAGVESVDHHLAVDRPGDLHAAVLEVVG